jgi:transcriptional regulator with XRE-family HTH domain
MADVAIEGPIGDRVRIYRGRRGLSQKELAGLIGRSESWLSQVERGVRSVDRFSVLVDIAQVLKTNVETLAGTRMQFAPNGDPQVDGIDAVSAALAKYPALITAHSSSRESLDNVERLCAEAHTRYQAADYSATARILPRLIETVDQAVVEPHRDNDTRRALMLQHQVYVVAAKLLTKTGDGHLAWLAADRAAAAAARLGPPALKGLAAYQVTCALLKMDRIEQAERIAIGAAESIDDDSPLGISAQGALFLIAAVIAGRRSDRKSATERLRRAQYLADALGEDANHGFTAFGPTNVAMHQVSVAAELGDAATAIHYAEQIDTSNLPAGLTSRRAQVHLDAAWAYAQHMDDAAVVINLMEAERVAPQMLRYNIVAREILRELLKREPRSSTPGLRALATRAGVLR